MPRNKPQFSTQPSHVPKAKLLVCFIATQQQQRSCLWVVSCVTLHSIDLNVAGHELPLLHGLKRCLFEAVRR